MAYLTVLNGSLQGQRFELSNAVTRIGRREEGNDIAIADPSISGSHCEIQKTGSSYFVRDLGSTNGTRVNGDTIQNAALFRNDIIMFGDISVMIEGEDLTATQKIDPSAIPRTTIVIPQKRPATITSKDFQKKANSNAIWISIIAVLLMIIGVMLYKFMTK